MIDQLLCIYSMYVWMNDRSECKKVWMRSGLNVSVRETLGLNTNASESLVTQQHSMIEVVSSQRGRQTCGALGTFHNNITK